MRSWGLVLSYILRIFAIIVGLGFIATVVYAQGSQGATVITENVLFSWGIVATIIGVVSTVITNLVQFRIHREDKNIHQTMGELRHIFATREDCIHIHNGLADTLDEIRKDIGDIRDRIARIEGKLQ